MTAPAPIGHNGPPSEGEVSLDKEGWIAIARAMRDHWLVGFGQPVMPVDEDRGSFSRSEAWIDLIMECRYSAGTVNNGGRKMELRSGQLLGAVSWLASRWNWTPKTVRGFLDKLEEEGMIERFTPGIHPGSDDVLNGHQKGKQKGKQAAVLTVCKYSIYQLADRLKGQAKGSSEGMQGASKGHAEGNIYKEETREQGNKGKPEPPAHNPGLAGLNGSTEPMVADVIRWMNAGDEKSARSWLVGTVAAYGQDVTKDAWAKLRTDIATGSLIAQPLQTWSKIAARMRDDRKRAPPATKRDEEMAKISAIVGPRR
jgi:hypothetical protein